MRHRKDGVKLNRTSSHRQAMFRNMVTSLLKHEKIHTTDVKAKELRRWADHIITLAKRGDLHARRQAMAIVREKDVVHKLFEQAQKRFGKINGGYTRIIKIGRRPGDAAPISLIELITVAAQDSKSKKKTKSAPKKKGQTTAKPAEQKVAEPKAEKAAAKKTKEVPAQEETQEATPKPPAGTDAADAEREPAQSESAETETQGDALAAKAEAGPAGEDQPAEEDESPKGEKTDK